VKDPNYNGEFNIIEKKIIESNNDYDYIFFDRKIEENTHIYNMF
jgi:hypothetical protein